ncbi:MAG: ATP-binding protein [Myxococcota bacterium]|nr:ATP-binding protein [Myxococcota bacterium]
MGRLSLRARILGAFLLSFFSFCGALVYGLSQLANIGGGLDVIDRGYLPLAKTVGQMEAYQSRLELDLERLEESRPRPLTGQSSVSVVSAVKLSENIATGLSIIAEVIPAISDTEEKATMTALQGQFERILNAHAGQQEMVQTYLQKAEAGDAQRALAMKPKLKFAQSKLHTEIEQVSIRISSATQRVSERTAQAQQRAVVVSGILALVALLFGSLMLILAVVSLRPISKLTNDVQRIAGGDYAARTSLHRTDELGILASEINAMATSIEIRDEALRTRAEELDAVLNAIRLGLVVVDEGGVVMANPAALGLWEIEVGGPLPVLLEEAREREEALKIGERFFALQKARFRGGFIIAGEDVTQLLQDREHLANTERLALVGQMLAQITHEVRNPLNALSLNAELLAEEVTGLPQERQKEGLEILQTMTSEIQNLEEVTEHYLSLVRRPAPLPGHHDPTEVVEGVARLLDEELRRSGVELQVNKAALPKIEMDDGQLRRALLNVVRNAMEAGSTRISIALDMTPDRLQILVEDDGEGMTDEQIQKASEPFFSTKAAGTGLGLAITRQILEDHGGGLYLERGKEGTRVLLSLPA